MKNLLVLALPLLLLACNSKLGAQIKKDFDQAQHSEELTKGKILSRSYFFKEANKDQNYVLYIPKNYDSSKPAPLIILLHGLRSNPKQIINYSGIISEAEKRGYVIAAPFGYNDRGWYGSRGKGKEGFAFGKAGDPENLGELSEMDVINVLKIVQKDLSIDSDRIFLMGHSMGGGGALYLASAYPNTWSGLACLAPAFQKQSTKLENAKHLPVYVTTGNMDFLVPVRTVRRWVDEMKSLKMDVHYKEIKGGGHFRTITRNPEMISEVYDFFDRYNRKKLAKPQVQTQ
ncbi:putative Poly(3-hydroxybutyrate) depolymerase [Lentisphaera araneosa HTCC2155]|uniref:Putative Poly(3-hydroxybutyrate) depolymerase n=1 Tax=Lentisphaera araneosa HTCC2155 TaxID=313628 RepID=A6DSG0_9BACT|nr:alpha/beta hydrolase [Lentisphaera araneosa]EDM25405.1 putative Poly(3-hydroxybutyrate) depolymerase [Lentisphaera araneosa HTCC2155]